ncbi:hypothetical protein [Minwuia thermotolerans]|uniref:UDP-glycosyltransferase n=1 Tax=Minwuia thermotolerans TaxID=2056226 RepID=A0A2M9G667_9PROT|nr:hypothetical protein [Minwuia thermotolerans]PJK31207.1 hypothetical protein CVT23_02970 [Minwuia thermotolerans]
MRAKRVLAVCYGAGHVNMVLPVLRELKRMGGFEIVALGLTTAWDRLDAAGFAPLRVRDLVDPELDAEALRVGAELALDLSPGGPVPEWESAAYLGISYRELVEDVGEARAAQLYRERGRAAFLPSRFARRAIERLQPDVLLTTNSPRMERAFLQAADELGLPNVVIWPSLADGEAEWVGRPRKNAIVCIDNDWAAQRLRAAGANDEMLRMTGGPQYEHLFAPDLKARAAAFRESHGWGDRFVLLWVSQLHGPVHPLTGEAADPGLPARIEGRLVEEVGRRADRMHLAIRYHPNELIREGNRPEWVSVNRRDDDLHVVLHAVDAMVTINSSVSYQAALLGKPVLQYMDSPYARFFPFDKVGIARPLRQLAAIPFELNHLQKCQYESQITNADQLNSALRVSIEMVKLTNGGSIPRT